MKKSVLRVYNLMMAAIDWRIVRGQEFSTAEAAEASDFGEVLGSFGFDADRSRDVLKAEPLSVGKRLFLAEKLSVDEASAMLFEEQDPRLLLILKDRFREEREKSTGGLITTN